MTHQLFLTDPAMLGAVAIDSTVLLDGDEGRHAATVVRIMPGERYLLADGHGRRVVAEATSVERGVLTGTVISIDDEPAPDPRFVLVQALAKGNRDEQAIEAATELGIDEVVPWQAERSVVVWRQERSARSLAKWRALIARATKQSRRSRMPLTSSPVTLASLARRVGQSALTLVLHEDAAAPLAGAALPERGDILIVVGPEGGISPRELEALVEAGARPVRLGPMILRASSAGPAALAVLNAQSRWR
ncbi:MAG: 16S rRNA (uracil(1498)-N(3))-methyltransferase [Micrococcales bacterium]|nr:16S rRNA (uracil(1498)-N(3))-methyltransferase [Micrococcales bacterium]